MSPHVALPWSIPTAVMRRLRFCPIRGMNNQVVVWCTFSPDNTMRVAECEKEIERYAGHKPDVTFVQAVTTCEFDAEAWLDACIVAMAGAR